MKKTLIITLISLILCSCGNKKNETQSIISTDRLSQKQIDAVMNKFKFSYELPIVLDSSEFVLFPMSTKLLDVRKSTSYSTDGYKYQSDGLPRMEMNSHLVLLSSLSSFKYQADIKQLTSLKLLITTICLPQGN